MNFLKKVIKRDYMPKKCFFGYFPIPFNREFYKITKTLFSIFFPPISLECTHITKVVASCPPPRFFTKETFI